jgi:hypothetical protein
VTAFIALDTSVLDRQIEELIEAINATTIAVQQVLTAVESLSTRIDALEGDHPDGPPVEPTPVDPPVEPPADPPTDPPVDPPPVDPPVEPSLSALVDENGDALTDENDQVLTEGAADG